MRPVIKEESPQKDDFDNYRDAFPELRGRIGPYCSYCERRIPTGLAIEHIQAKKYKDGNGEYPYKHLVGKWSNFLLACVNCNSTKGNKNVTLDNVFLPDRDNSFQAFLYEPDGSIKINPEISQSLKALAMASLELTGLDRTTPTYHDKNGDLVALDRVQDRAEAFLTAIEALQDWETKQSEALKNPIVRNAVGLGFFSVWMTVFHEHEDIKLAFVESFPGTSSICFDSKGLVVTPRPNDHYLDHGGKI